MNIKENFLDTLKRFIKMMKENYIKGKEEFSILFLVLFLRNQH